MRLLIVLSFSFLGFGCATVFTGYTSNLEIHNLPDSLRVYTSEGVELHGSYARMKPVVVHRSEVEVISEQAVDSTYQTFRLRSNRDHILLFKGGNSEYRRPAYAKLSGWWFALDLVCGGIPIVVDAMTGNWNYYDPIEFQ